MSDELIALGAGTAGALGIGAAAYALTKNNQQSGAATAAELLGATALIGGAAYGAHKLFATKDSVSQSKKTSTLIDEQARLAKASRRNAKRTENARNAGIPSDGSLARLFDPKINAAEEAIRKERAARRATNAKNADKALDHEALPRLFGGHPA